MSEFGNFSAGMWKSCSQSRRPPSQKSLLEGGADAHIGSKNPYLNGIQISGHSEKNTSYPILYGNEMVKQIIDKWCVREGKKTQILKYPLSSTIGWLYDCFVCRGHFRPDLHNKEKS